MTEAEKIERVQTLLPEDAGATETVVTEYLAVASDLILDKLYPFKDTANMAVPLRYHGLQCEVAAWAFSRRGALGEAVHNENGINRTYGSSDGCELLSRLTPYAGVS